MIRFTVLGVPAPQGSKVRTRWGMREDNPRTRPWRDMIAYEAKAAMEGGRPIIGPLKLEVTFWMPRPKSHYRTGAKANMLKPQAPRFCDKKPDVDKLLRALGDGMTTAGVWMDDSQVVEVDASKRYIDNGVAPGCSVTVMSLAGTWRTAA